MTTFGSHTPQRSNAYMGGETNRFVFANGYGASVVRHDYSPQQSLATALGGTILGPDSILVDGHLVVASVLGVVRVDGQAIGMWNDGTPALVARYRAVA